MGAANYPHMPAFASLFTMWRDPRKLALMAMTAGLYAAGGMTTKALQIIPGFTDLRPAAVFPVVLGVLLGAPACWGAALGNLVQDLLGGEFGPGSAVGLVANFLLAMVSWRVAALLGLGSQLSGREPARGFAWKGLLRFVPAALLASAACAVALGWGLDVMGSMPFAGLGNIVFLNNALASLVLGPPLLALLGGRVQRWELADEVPPASPRLGYLGLGLLTGGSLGGYLALNALSLGATAAPGLAGVTPVGGLALGLIALGLLLL